MTEAGDKKCCILLYRYIFIQHLINTTCFEGTDDVRYKSEPTVYSIEVVCFYMLNIILPARPISISLRCLL